MSVFSNKDIRSALETGHAICHPLIPDNVRGSSIDLTLGENYFEVDDSAGVTPGIYNPFDQEDVDRYFGLSHTATPWVPRSENPFFGKGYSQQLVGIPENHPVIVIKARGRILAHTHEFVGIHPPGTSEMRARSSWGRNGIAVCMCAGWGDPGYINRWTMEITNFNDEAVPLPIGERVAQIIFHQTGDVDGTYGDGGKYQGGDDIDQIIENWTPDQMLPRSYSDDRSLPLELTKSK